MRRRNFLASLALPAAAQQRPIQTSLLFPSPGKGSAVMAVAYYAKPKGLDMISLEQRWSRSDTIDVIFRRSSKDNGRTWSSPAVVVTGEKAAQGKLRRHYRAGYPDPASGRLLEFWMEAVLPSDDPLEGLRRWGIFYSIDGGPKQQVILKGRTAESPLPGVTLGVNGYMLGDHGSAPITAPDGRILVPFQIFPARDGRLYNPAGGYTWSDAAVLHGQWRGASLEWSLSNLVLGDPKQTTRGMVEPTIAFLDKDKVLMVLRGSNDKDHSLPGYKWFSISTDSGRTFPPAQPWTFTNRRNFFSPSATSQLLSHPNGKIYWLGNITPENPKGNRPRYPFVLGEVDRQSGLLIESSLRQIDNRRPQDHELLTLSNFHAIVDRPTRDIRLFMTRLVALPDGWQGDGLEYRIPV
jgi:hypothetical protein